MVKSCTFCKHAKLGNGITLVCLKVEQVKGIVQPAFVCKYYQKDT